MTLEIQDLSYFIKKRALIEGITLDFRPGILYGILGPNGSGKSTLLKTISRIWNPTTGKLFWQGEDLLKFSRREMSRTVSLVPQNPPSYFDFTVLHMASMGRYPQGGRSPQGLKQIEKALEEVDAWHLRDQMLTELSGGEKQRVYIARALATQAPILLLDEPTSYLDLRHQLEIWHLLRKIVKEGKLVIVAVHDLQAAERFCDQLVILQNGRSRANGPYNAIMTPNLLNDVFGVSLNGNSNIFELK